MSECGAISANGTRCTIDAGHLGTHGNGNIHWRNLHALTGQRPDNTRGATAQETDLSRPDSEDYEGGGP